MEFMLAFIFTVLISLMLLITDQWWSNIVTMLDISALFTNWSISARNVWNIKWHCHNRMQISFLLSSGLQGFHNLWIMKIKFHSGSQKLNVNLLKASTVSRAMCNWNNFLLYQKFMLGSSTLFQLTRTFEYKFLSLIAAWVIFLFVYFLLEYKAYLELKHT